MSARRAQDFEALDGAGWHRLVSSRVRPFERAAQGAIARPAALASDVRNEWRGYFPADPVPAAVLVPIVQRLPAPTVLLTQRSTNLKHHPGQISFPGGRLESGDVGAVAAALREAREEIGLAAERVEVVGVLPDHLIVSGYRVTPVVGFVRTPFELALGDGEVDEVFEVPLAFLMDPRNHVPRQRTFEGRTIELQDIPYGPRNIWGATAGMLQTLSRVLRGEEG
jgi:8-oxo-dGTP pyrophosphatase MutT (NUDIX family)